MSETRFLDPPKNMVSKTFYRIENGVEFAKNSGVVCLIKSVESSITLTGAFTEGKR